MKVNLLRYIYYQFKFAWVEAIILFYVLLFFFSFLYSSAGHGGASGYLALMALFSISPDVMKPTALLLNLFVSLTSFIQFFRGKHFRWKLFLPVSYTHLRAHETGRNLVCRLLLE